MNLCSSCFSGDRLDLEDDFFKTSSSNNNNKFVELSNNPKVSILQAPIAKALHSSDTKSVDLFVTSNGNVLKKSKVSPIIHSSFTTESPSRTNIFNQQASNIENKRVTPSIFPSSTPMFPKGNNISPRPTLPILNKNNLNKPKNVPGSSLVGLNSEDDIVELPVNFNAGKTSVPLVLGNPKNIIKGDSRNIQVYSLGTAAEVNQNLVNLQLANLNNAKQTRNDQIIKQSQTPTNIQNINNEKRHNTNTDRNTQKSEEKNQKTNARKQPQIISEPKKNTQVKEKPKIFIHSQNNKHDNVKSSSLTKLETSLSKDKVASDIGSMTIGDYLLSLNGKNGIVVLPLSGLFNRRNTATSRPIGSNSVTSQKAESSNIVTQQTASNNVASQAKGSNNIISQLTKYAISEGLVDELKSGSTTTEKSIGFSLANRKDNPVAAVSFGNTGTISRDDKTDLKVQPIETSSLLKLLSSLSTGNPTQGFSSQSNIQSSSIKLKESNIQQRDAASGLFGSTRITTKRPDIFRRTLSDFFFVKGQWIGTLLGGLIDMGEVFSDAIKEIAKSSKKNS